MDQSAKPALPGSEATLPEAAQVAKQSPTRLRGLPVVSTSAYQFEMAIRQARVARRSRLVVHRVARGLGHPATLRGPLVAPRRSPEWWGSAVDVVRQVPCSDRSRSNIRSVAQPRRPFWFGYASAPVRAGGAVLSDHTIDSAQGCCEGPRSSRRRRAWNRSGVLDDLAVDADAAPCGVDQVGSEGDVFTQPGKDSRARCMIRGAVGSSPSKVLRVAARSRARPPLGLFIQAPDVWACSGRRRATRLDLGVRAHRAPSPRTSRWYRWSAPVGDPRGRARHAGRGRLQLNPVFSR